MRNSLRMSIAGIIAAALLVAGPALAGKEGKKIEPTEFKLTGKLVKEHMVKKEKNGKVHTMDVFLLITDNEKIHLPQAALRDKEGNPTGAFNLDEFAGNSVIVDVEGYVHNQKEKKCEQKTQVLKVVYIRLAQDL